MSEIEGPEEYRSWFPRMFSEKLRLSGLDDDCVCDEFSIALSTVSRWKNGRCAPHPLIGVLVIRWLDQQVAAIKQL